MSNRKRYSRAPSSSSKTSIQRSIAAALSTTGTLVIANTTSRVEPTVGDQGWLPASAEPYLYFKSDIFSVVSAAVLRTVANPQNSTVATGSVREPRFWIKRAKLELVVTNSSQCDVDVFVNTAYARYDCVDMDFLQNSPSLLESQAASGTVSGNNIVGWTPFQSKVFTESYRLGKTRKVHLQGGQNYRFVVRDNKPMYLNYAKLFPASGGAAESTTSFANRSCTLFLRAVAAPLHEAGESDIIKWGPVALDCVTVKTYEWVSSPMPYHYNDIFDINATLTNPAGIQPQTGGLNADFTVSS